MFISCLNRGSSGSSERIVKQNKQCKQCDTQVRKSSQSPHYFQRRGALCLYSVFVNLCICVFVYCVFPLWMHRSGRAVNVPPLVTLTDHQPGHKHGKPHSRDFCKKEISRISKDIDIDVDITKWKVTLKGYFEILLWEVLRKMLLFCWY